MVRQRLLVGTYTRREPHAPGAGGEGLALFAFDEERGLLRAQGVVAEVVNPSFVAAHPQGGVAYAVSEVPRGTLHTFGVPADRAALEPLGTHTTHGAAPAHVSVRGDGRIVFAVNYGSGVSVAAYATGPGGEILGPPATATHAGRGRDPHRQDAPHAHCARPSPDGRQVHVTDLGTDEVVTYQVAPDPLTLRRTHTLALPAGSGPRHLSFHPDGRTGFVSLELSSGLAVVRREPRDGHLSVIQVCPTYAGGSPGVPAEVLVSPCGEFVYVSNRGRDTLAVFRWSAAAQAATLIQEVPAQGRTPRSMTLSPLGGALLVGNQDSDSIAVFSRDAASGRLTPHSSAPCGTPAGLCFMP